MQPAPTFLGLPFLPENGPPYALIGAGIVLLAVAVGLVLLGLSLRDMWLRKRKLASEHPEDQPS